MATYTTNYNLEKPAQTDIYNVDVFNANADKIDAGLTDKAEKTMLAPVETTNSASRSYAKGEYFVYNNVLCCATTAIAAGGTIAIGTNCSTAPVGGELKSLRDALTKNYTQSGGTSILAYSSTSNMFVAPSDGYIMAQVWNSDSNVNIWIGTSALKIPITNGMAYALFVRKGLSYWVAHTGNNCSCTFASIT